MTLQKNKLIIVISTAFLVLNLFFAKQAFAQQDYPSCVEMGLGTDVCSSMFPDGNGRPSGGQPGSSCTVATNCSFTNAACERGVCVTKSSGGSTVTPSECAVDRDCGASNKYCDPLTFTCKTKTTRDPGDTGRPTTTRQTTRDPGDTAGGCPVGYEQADGGLCIPKSPFSGNSGTLTSAKTLPELVLIVLKMLLMFAGIVAVVLIVVGGFQYMTSGGNDEQAEKGKKALTNAVIGLVIVMLAFAIVQIITNTLTKQIIF